MSGNRQYPDILGPEDAREQLNAIEALENAVSGDDEFLQAILQNTKVQTMALLDRMQARPRQNPSPFPGHNPDVRPVPDDELYRREDLPPSTVGLANRYIQEGDIGPGTFQVRGTIVNDTVRATEDIRAGDPVQVIAPGNIVQLRPDVSVSFFGLSGAAGSGGFEVTQTPSGSNVTIQPGDTETVVSAATEGATWVGVGTNDETHSLYQYYIDNQAILDDPLTQPLGLYNDPFYFPQGQKVERQMQVRVTRENSASGSADYYSKLIYIE